MIGEFEKIVEEKGVWIEPCKHRFTAFNIDVSFSFVILTLCLSGTARALYDQREMTHHKNDLALLLPGHVMRPLECSEDYTYARIAISRAMIERLRPQLFSHDYMKYGTSPVFSLTDEQAKRLLQVLEHMAFTAAHSELEMTHRNHILLAQMVVGYEYINYYRKEQDRLLPPDNNAGIFSRFCDLVVEHYHESKEIQYYASLLDLHPKYLSRVVRTATNGVTPGQWIDRYVVAQAKRLMATNPELSLKQIAFELGFSEPTSFYRYFKRVTGLTANEFRHK
jgi:AraC-like DNA-binding protein